ncbi:unnamed protein product, partial [Allacma fusca]
MNSMFFTRMMQEDLGDKISHGKSGFTGLTKLWSWKFYIKHYYTLQRNISIFHFSPFQQELQDRMTGNTPKRDPTDKIPATPEEFYEALITEAPLKPG